MMKFDFFTFGGRFLWEDVFNYQGWIIQRHVTTRRHRLLDPHHIRRESGRFDECKTALLKYIAAYEIEAPYKDTVLILHGFARSRKSIEPLADSLKDLKANIIAINYASLLKGLQYHTNWLIQFFKNIEINGHLHIITVGASCLLLRKFIAASNNYREYNIANIININPCNSGSDLAELFSSKEFFNKIFGPMLYEISPKKTTNIPRIPQEIPLGIIFCPSKIIPMVKDTFKKYDSFPFDFAPSEYSYSPHKINIQKLTYRPLKNVEMFNSCRNFILNSTFEEVEPQKTQPKTEKKQNSKPKNKPETTKETKKDAKKETKSPHSSKEKKKNTSPKS